MPSCKSGCLSTLLGGFRKDRHAEEGRHEADDQKVEENDESTPAKGSPSSDAAGNVSQTTELRQDDGLLATDDKTTSDADGHRGQQVINQADSIHKALWDKAYNNLKNDPAKTEYVSRYEELLQRVFLSQYTAEKVVETNEYSQHLGEEQMKKVVEEGLVRIEKYKKAIENSESTVNVIKQLKAILDIPLKNVSQTALPWAVISSSIDILLKPVSTGAALYNGVAYAISRIEWYSKLTDKVLCEDSMKDEKSLHGIREDIAGRITSLYESLLLYQIKSVCFYYRKYQLLVWARGLLELDDWSGEIKHIQEAEDALSRDCALYDMEQLKDQMRAMIMDTKTAEDSQEFQKRLQAIRRVDPQATVKTIQVLKESVMDDLYTWVFNTEQFKSFRCWGEKAPRRLWISGQAGTGKTMLSIGTIKELQTRGLRDPVAPTILYFFCQHTDADLNNGVAVLQSLVWMLLRQQPHLSSHLDEQFSHSGQKFISDCNSFATWCDLLTSMLIDSARVIIAVDALDECEEGSRRQLLRFMNGIITKERMSHVKWFITSRPLLEIPDSRPETTLQYHRLLLLDDHNLIPWINAYIDRKVQVLRDKAQNQERVDRIKDQLHDRASNTYIWVSLVFEEIENAPEARWQKVIEDTPRQLNELYDYLLRQLPWLECKSVLCVAMVARRPLSLWEIEQLTGMETGVNAGRDYVTGCRSFLSIRGEMVYFIHQTAQDWLLLNQHQLRDGFSQDHGGLEKCIHREILENSMEGMKKTLSENIYQLPHYDIAIEEIETPSQDPLAPIRYACQYWAYHLKEGELKTDIDLLGFLRQCFLHWLEALALMRIMPETVGIIDMLSSMPVMTSNPEVRDFLLDAKRFVWRHQQTLMIAPLQVYVALMFTPKTSLVRNSGALPEWILQGPDIEENWGSLLQTFEHSSSALSVTLSPSDRIIAGTDGNMVRIWDARTGIMIRCLLVEEYDFIEPWDAVHWVHFTSDSQLLLASTTQKVFVWDTVTWEMSHTVGCTDGIDYITVSPNSLLLACLHGDGRITLWQRNGTSWRLRWTHHSSGANWQRIEPACLSFSFNNRLLAYTMYPSSFGVLDTERGKLHQAAVPWGVRGRLNAVKFCRDGKLLLQADDTIEIWRHEDKWELDCTFELPMIPTNIAVSPNDRLIALSGDGSAIHVVDRQEGMIVQTLRGHTSEACDLAFSSDGQFLVSSGSDITIRLWVIAPEEYDKVPVEQCEAIEGVALSADGSLFVTVRPMGKIETWNGYTEEHQKTLKAPRLNIVEFTVTISPDNKLVAWVSDDGCVAVWDAETGQVIATQDRRLRSRRFCPCCYLQFSSTSKLLGWIEDVGTIRVWSIQPCRLLKEYQGGDGIKYTVSTIRRKGREKLSLVLQALENELNMSKEVGYSPENCLSQDDAAHTPRITVEDDWVVLGEQKSIWLPPEYRPWWLYGGWDAQSNVLVIGLESGRFYSIRFNPHEMSAGQLQRDDAEEDYDTDSSSGSLPYYSYVQDESASDGLPSDSENSADGE